MQVALSAFNRGKISPLALARTDFKRTALSAEVQTNFMPRALGSMMLRPGLEYTGATKNNSASVTIPFVFAVDDTARIELVDVVMRVWVNDALITRPSVTTAITNGTFNSDIASWTDQDGGSAASTWATGGYMQLVGTGTAAARRRQQVTVSGGNVGVKHALYVAIARGPVKIRVGSSAGGDEYVSEATLHTGYHSLAFTPSGDFYVDLFSYEPYVSLVDAITVSSAGTMEVTTPWAAADLEDLRWDQSGDIVFVACTGKRQYKIERRPNESWSVAVYQSDDGPFMVQNVGPVTITPSALTGDINLVSSASFFRSGHVGALFKLTQAGQTASVSVTAENQFSSSIRVTGVDAQRAFSVIITGTWSATVTLQQSTDDATWVDAVSGSYVANTAVSYDDTLDNQIIYYRIGVKTGGFTSGTVEATLSYNSGTQTGVARVTGYINAVTVTAQVLQPFSKTTATEDWSESYWSDYRGYPSAVAFYEGRLWWAGRDRLWGSVSDSFYSYDDEYEGDAAPLNRSIGSGPVDRIYWLIAMDGLILGAGGKIWAVRSSSLDEPVTPTNFNLKPCGQGSAVIAGAVIDKSAVYVQRSGTRLFEVSQGDDFKYGADDLAKHVPEIGEPSIVRIAVQFQPETRVHCVRSDGTVGILIFDPAEEIQCWVDVETDGDVEDVVVLPGTVEDEVYYTVKRTIGGTKRYHEKWAMESECEGGTLNKQADSFLSASGSGASITGLSHLEGEEVVCWADGEYKGTFTVSSGAIAQAYTTGYVVGLPYTATYKSTKLAYGVDERYQSALIQKKRVSQLGIIARNIHPTGLQYGPSFDFMDDLPLVEDAETIDADTIREAYDEEMFTFAGTWDTDSRLCLKAVAPKPATLLAAVIGMETSPK